MRNLIFKFCGLALTLSVLCVSQLAMAASTETGLDLGHVDINVTDKSAVQRGAATFMNYCLSCHSAEYMRYNRLAEDLDLPEQLVEENLIFGDQKIGDRMTIAMTEEDGAEWFGKTPPDLSVIGRSRTPEWLYGYLMSFYQDENGNWNNVYLPNAAMPHVLWSLQGIQEPVYGETQGEGEIAAIVDMELVEPGLQSEEEYEETVHDLVAFLAYLGEPALLKRQQIGVWVILFLALFTFIAYLLKAEFWRDIH